MGGRVDRIDDEVGGVSSIGTDQVEGCRETRKALMTERCESCRMLLVGCGATT